MNSLTNVASVTSIKRDVDVAGIIGMSAQVARSEEAWIEVEETNFFRCLAPIFATARNFVKGLRTGKC